MSIKDKLTSRKLWMSIAAFLGSIGTSIAGIATDKPGVAMVGVVCGVLSAAIYAGCEAYVDAAAVNQVIDVVTDYEEEEDE